MIVKAGQRAPWSGVLVTHKYLATVVSQLETERARLKVELEALTKRAAAELKAADGILEIERRAFAGKYAACQGDKLRRDKIYEDALKRCQDRSILKSPTLWTVIGAAVGAGVCGLGVGLGR